MGKDLRGKELGSGLSQRKDGRYQARLTLKDGSRKEKNFIKVTDAREWLSEQRYTDKVFGTSDMTVDEWFWHWLQTYKEGIVADSTTKGYRNRYKGDIQSVIGHLRLSEVRKVQCQEIINSICRKGIYSEGTIGLTKITLHAIFKDAVENGYILSNPADNLKINRVTMEEHEYIERRVLTRIEQRVFKEYASSTYYYNAYCLVLETGLRVGELGGLQWQDIDFEKKCLVVKRTLLQEKARGGFYFGAPKSQNSKRTIPLTDTAISILKNQRILQSKAKAKSKNWIKKWDGLVFTTNNGNPVGASTFRDMIIRIVNNINFDRGVMAKQMHEPYVEFEHMTMHTLRHTFATRCIENGMNPKTLQKILGHSTLSLTMDLYVHCVDEQLFSEMEKMNVAV